MARVTALALRAAAREAMLAAGGRGFMRFLPPGGALLATDAVRRCADEAQKVALHRALQAAGFVCTEKDGLLMLTPGNALLDSIDCDEEIPIDWASPQHQMQALGVLWGRKSKKSLTPDGRQLIIEALRLSWQPPRQAGIDALRAQAAVMLRRGDDSGFHEAGKILMDWCSAQQGGNDHEA